MNNQTPSLSGQRFAEAGAIRKTRTIATKPSELIAAATIVIAFVAGCYTGSSCTSNWTVAPLKSQAIEKGFAEWQVIDQNQGITKFVWKEIDLSNKPTEHIANETNQQAQASANSSANYSYGR